MAALRPPTPRTGYLLGAYLSAIDDSEQPFALWVPRTYTARRAYPLIVALHGDDADERTIPEECFRMHERGFREDVLVLSPFGRGDLGWQWLGEADVWDAMNWVKQRYRIDARRQYLTGLSSGGFATWRLACAYPDQWAAIAPVCGGGDPAALPSLKRIPVWCVHGERDSIVPVSESRRLVAELNRLKYRCRYDELSGWKHEAWEWLYDPERPGDSLAEWFLKFRKARGAPPVLRPQRQGVFNDLFTERLVISFPARTSIPPEVDVLRAEAEAFARFSFGDRIMRRGKLVMKTDEELTCDDLAGASHLMLGRTDNHRGLKAVERRLLARHVRGQLRVRGESYLSKSLVAVTCQPSPWNRARLLGVVTYQQFRQLRGLAGQLCMAQPEALAVNLYDTEERRFIRREAVDDPSRP
jgi:hypothetical protein